MNVAGSDAYRWIDANTSYMLATPGYQDVNQRSSGIDAGCL